MATHGFGTLGTLIRNRSHNSLQNMRRPSSFRGRETNDDEEIAWGHRISNEESEDPRRNLDERRQSAVLLGPQMRSQRLIGNSNPRYKWEKYWKTEEELKPMKKPMCVVSVCICGETMADGAQTTVLRTNEFPRTTIYLHRSAT